MKIAKKVLALVMALAMVAVFACVSFAATANVSEIADGQFTVSVAVDANALESADFTVTYDATVLEYVDAVAGVAAPAMCMGNVTGEGEVSVSLFWLASYTGSDSIAVLTFKVIDADAAEATLVINGLEATATETVVTLKEVEETTVEETTVEETTVEETTVEETTVEVEESSSVVANPDTGDQNTGDNMALAAAAGVVALAGVAFVLTKKRK